MGARSRLDQSRVRDQVLQILLGVRGRKSRWRWRADGSFDSAKPGVCLPFRRYTAHSQSLHPPYLLQEARYVIESVICDPNFEGLILGCIEADFCK